MSKIVPKQIIFAWKFYFSTRCIEELEREKSLVFFSIHICAKKNLRSVHWNFNSRKVDLNFQFHEKNNKNFFREIKKNSITQCPKIEKCNFKRAKKQHLHFQKWQKINFCTRNKFKTTKNSIFGLFSGAKIHFFCHFWNCK